MTESYYATLHLVCMLWIFQTQSGVYPGQVTFGEAWNHVALVGYRKVGENFYFGEK